MTRRGLIAGTGAIALMGTSLSACSQSADYEALAREVWTLPEQTASPDLQWYVRHAILAANSHNTQPWKFSGTGARVIISPDLSRATPVVDPDNHHLFTSLGCAAENVVISAGAQGKSAAVSFNSEREGAIEIDIAGQSQPQAALYAAIPERQCTRSDYAGAPVSRDELDQLYSAAKAEGVDVLFLIDKSGMDPLLPIFAEAAAKQANDADFVKELKRWIRFSAPDAMRTRDGLYSACSGNPVVPAWIGNMMFSLFYTASSEADKLVRQIRSSSGIAVFTGVKNEPEGWVRVGRSYQRFALQATALGIRHAFVNQPIEVAETRPAFAKATGFGGRRPDLVVRFGHAPAMPRSLRRPVGDVLKSA